MSSEYHTQYIYIIYLFFIFFYYIREFPCKKLLLMTFSSPHTIHNRWRQHDNTRLYARTQDDKHHDNARTNWDVGSWNHEFLVVVIVIVVAVAMEFHQPMVSPFGWRTVIPGLRDNCEWQWWEWFSRTNHCCCWWPNTKWRIHQFCHCMGSIHQKMEKWA